MQVNIKKPGQGKTLPAGSTVRVHYTGRLENGQVFDSSYNQGEALEFRLGMGQVISCWDKGLQQLNKGAEAELVCPLEMANGSKAHGPIPPNSTLIFDVKVVSYGFY